MSVWCISLAMHSPGRQWIITYSHLSIGRPCPCSPVDTSHAWQSFSTLSHQWTNQAHQSHLGRGVSPRLPCLGLSIIEAANVYEYSGPSRSRAKWVGPPWCVWQMSLRDFYLCWESSNGDGQNYTHRKTCSYIQTRNIGGNTFFI